MKRNQFESKAPKKELTEEELAKYNMVAKRIAGMFLEIATKKTEAEKEKARAEATNILKKLVAMEQFRLIDQARLTGEIKKNDSMIRNLQKKWAPETVVSKPTPAREAWLSEEAPGVVAQEVIAAEEHGAKEREKAEGEENIEMIEAELEELKEDSH